MTLRTSTLSAQVLLSICSLLTDPNPDDPLVPEIAHMCAFAYCNDAVNTAMLSKCSVQLLCSSALMLMPLLY